MADQTETDQEAHLAEARAAHRNYLLQGHIDMSRDYDKLVTTMAAGGIGLALLFLRERDSQAEAVWTAIAGSVLFTCSLLAILSSQLLSQRLVETMVVRLNKGDQKVGEREERLDVWVESLTVAAAALLVFGIVFLTIFVGRNA